MNEQREALAEVLAGHRYRDVLGDYEVAPYYKHFGCSCGWEQNIAGMNGWWSWVAAHEAHVAEALARMLADAEQRGAARVAAAVDGAIRLVSPDHVTPMGARQLRAALTHAAAQDPA